MSGLRKTDVFIISGFVVYRCHGNIDFSKIAIITSRFKILGIALKKLYRNTLS